MKKIGKVSIGLVALMSFATMVPVVNADELSITSQIETRSVKKYSVSYNLDGGTNAANNPSEFTGTSTVKLEEPTKKGYKFAGWYTDSDFKTPITEIAKGTAKNITLYAKWRIQTSSIYYELNGGINNENNPSSYTVETPTITLQNARKQGYTFKGWFTDAKLTKQVKTIATGSTGAVRFYAKWAERDYTITYNLDGGVNATSNPSVYTISSAVKFEEPTKKGYKFAGWYTDSEFKNPVTEIVKGTGKDLTLYAKWRIQTSTIYYELNGGINNESNPSSYTVETPTITLQNARKQGYTFKGWFTDAKLTKQVKTIATGSTGAVRFYAKWAERDYTITYNLDGGMNATSNPSVYTISSAIKFEEPTKKGYKFAGWYTDSDFKNPITEITKGTGKDLTLYAKWRIQTSTIYYELNGGTNHKSNPTSYTVESPKITIYNAQRTGYKFLGWFSDAKFTNKAKTIETGSTGAVRFYAKWEEMSYKITYNLDGGTNVTSNPSVFKISSSTIKLVEPTKKGYKFAGWYTDSEYKNSITEITKGTAENITLYAKWRVQTSSILYELNSGTNHKSNPSSYTVESPTIKLFNASRVGYKFAGWYSDKNYGTRVYEIPQGSTGAVKVYAKWITETPSIKSITNNKYNKSTIEINSVMNAWGYIIYRSTNSSTGFVKIADIVGTTYEDTTILPGKNYYYKVTAYVIDDYGKKVETNFSAKVKNRSAKKPQIRGYLHNPDDWATLTWIYLENLGDETLYVGGSAYTNFGNVYPYKGANYTKANLVSSNNLVSSVQSVYYDPHSSGYAYFRLTSQRLFGNGAHIAFVFVYDGCAYFMGMYDDGVYLYQ